MVELCEQALAQLRLQLEHRPSERRMGDEGTITTPIVERLLETLGFGHLDRVPLYRCNSNPARTTDIACRYPGIVGERFFQDQREPLLLVENKSTNSRFSLDRKMYWQARKQLREQLLGGKCNSTRFGLISNGWELQLFRRHHKVVHPLTPILELSSEKAEIVARQLLQILQAPERGLIIGIYNNKGGIGKTTIATNLGIVLAQKGYKVLLVDFDPNQADLTDLLQKKTVQNTVWDFLKGKSTIETIVQSCDFNHRKKQVQVDMMPADKHFLESDDAEIRQNIRKESLREHLIEAAKKYDYILVDMPPNWRWFAQMGVLASDVLLVPASHTDRASLQNLEDVVTKFLPEVSQWREKLWNEAGPGLLPLILNRYRDTPAQARNCKKFLESITNQNNGWKETFNDFFYIKGRFGSKRILELPYRVEICRSPLEGPKYFPAPLRYKRAGEVYKNLIREVLI